MRLDQGLEARPATARAEIAATGYEKRQAMRLCARWWRRFSTSVIYPVTSNLCD